MAQPIMKAVSREYRDIIRQFMEFRQKTWSVIDELNDYSDRLVISEQVACQTFPVYDYRYKADPDSPFRKYDCIAPSLKHHIKVPPCMQTGFYGKDIAIHMNYNRDKLALRKLLYSELLTENKQLREHNARLQEEL